MLLLCTTVKLIHLQCKGGLGAEASKICVHHHNDKINKKMAKMILPIDFTSWWNLLQWLKWLLRLFFFQVFVQGLRTITKVWLKPCTVLVSRSHILIQNRLCIYAMESSYTSPRQISSAPQTLHTIELLPQVCKSQPHPWPMLPDNGSVMFDSRCLQW